MYSNQGKKSFSNFTNYPLKVIGFFTVPKRFTTFGLIWHHQNLLKVEYNRKHLDKSISYWIQCSKSFWITSNSFLNFLFRDFDKIQIQQLRRKCLTCMVHWTCLLTHFWDKKDPFLLGVVNFSKVALASWKGLYSKLF